MDPLVVATIDHRLTGDALRAALDADDDPTTVVAVVATAGTTNAGIVDDLEGVGQLARERGLWYHVDAAYGGAAMLGRSRRELFEGCATPTRSSSTRTSGSSRPSTAARSSTASRALARATHTQHASYLDVLHVVDDEGEAGVEPLGLRRAPLAARARAAAVVLARRARHRRCTPSRSTQPCCAPPRRRRRR